MTTRSQDVETDLDRIEGAVDGRSGESGALLTELKALLEPLPKESPARARVLRLMGVLKNRLKCDRDALADLSEAKARAEEISSPDYRELVKIGRETAVVHAWRGDDRSAALELLPALAYACLQGDQKETARIIGEFGRVELEARRFDNVARLLRLYVKSLSGKGALPLTANERRRMTITLCQALNHIGEHEEALSQAKTLLDELPPEAGRLAFLAQLEVTRAHGKLKRFAEADQALEEAKTFLQDKDESAYEHIEHLQVETELCELKDIKPAVDRLEELIAGYDEQNLARWSAATRRSLANVLFELDRKAEAHDVLSTSLRIASGKSELDDLADEIRSDMLKFAGADHLEELVKAIDESGGRKTVNRRFIRLGRLGKGGQGEVHKAIDLRNGEHVALKKVDLRSYSVGRRDAIIQTIKTEYAVAERLNDDRFARVLDLVMVPEGPVFIIQRFIDGPTLRTLYADRADPKTLLELLAQIAEGLDYLHRQDVVHRDVKPENVIVASGDKAVLIDLGIALVGGRPDGLERFGTPPYVAPEQLSGGKVDGRADIYALGFMIAEAFGAEPPGGLTFGFFGRKSQTMPHEISKLVQSMVKTNPKSRPADLAAIAETLRQQRRQLSQA